MKSASLSFLVFVILTCSSAFSETELKLSDILARDFTAISVEEARAIAKRVGESGIGINSRAFIDAAIKSNRLEIIDVCFEENSVSNMFSMEVYRMPDSPLKEQIISRHLRNPRCSWVNEGDKFTYGEGTREFMAKSWWIPLLRKYLPDLPMDYAVLNTREKRLKLADAFDKAAGIPIVVEPEAVRVWPPKPAGKAEANSTARPVPQAPSAPSVAPAPIAGAASLRDGSFMWLSAAAAALAAAIALLFARSRRNG